MVSRSRREFVRSVTFGAAAFATPGVFAETLTLTPEQTEGPFYPDRLPLDTDNDLLIINDSITPAVGEITHLSGRVLDAKGRPVRNAMVEIWQVDGRGMYLHSRSAGERRDANFQGFGRFLTDARGRYYFRTVKPVLYPGRAAPHIHFAVDRGGKRVLTTQCYVKDYPHNERDGVFRRIDPAQREAVLVDFKPIEGSKLGELSARFDIVVGQTPVQT